MKRFLPALALATAGIAGAYTYLTSPPSKWGGPPTGSDSGGGVTFLMNDKGTPDIPGGPSTGDGEAATMKSDLAKWSAPTGGRLDLVYGGGTSSGATPGDGKNVVAFDTGLGTGIGGVTTSSYGSGSMFESDTVLNEDVDWSDLKLFENVLLHELGHGMGLDHTTASPAIMATMASGLTELQPDDVAAIKELYGTSGGSSPPPPGGGSGGGSSSSGGDSGGGDSGHKKRCGLTGIEFPILFLGWHLLRRRKARAKR